LVCVRIKQVNRHSNTSRSGVGAADALPPKGSDAGRQFSEPCGDVGDDWFDEPPSPNAAAF
jgi:hypothetical protein